MRSSLSLYLLMVSALVSFSSCEIVGGIFKAGMWTAFIIVALVVGIIIWLFSRRR
jgi:peptidoglycan/LPS O-acetylase OafA/YrhL